MADRVRFFKGAFDHFMQMEMSSLEKEIAKSNKFLQGKTVFKNLREQRIVKGLWERHDVLLLILQLRKNETSMTDFEARFRLFN